MDAAEIIAITDPVKTFGPDPKRALKVCNRLLTEWHPDTCRAPQARAVTDHLLFLRRLLKGKPDAVAGKGREIILARADGSKFQIHAIQEMHLDLGRQILGHRSLSTIYPKDLADLAEKEVGNIRGFRFPDAKMDAEMRKFLPQLIDMPKLRPGEALADGARIVTLIRDPEEILLSDLLRIKGAMPPAHVGWLGNRLLTLACWMDWAQLVHGAIAPEYILVDPAMHGARLMGGWALATKAGARPSILPRRSLDLMPGIGLPDGKVDNRLDRNLIRQCLREALGDAAGTRLEKLGVPVPMIRWLNAPPLQKATDDQAAWRKALEGAFGPPRFVDYDVRARDIY